MKDEAYVFLILKESSQLQFDKNTGKQYAVPFLIPLEIGRGKVKANMAYGTLLESGVVVNGWNIAVPQALYEQHQKESEVKA